MGYSTGNLSSIGLHNVTGQTMARFEGEHVFEIMKTAKTSHKPICCGT